VPRAFRTFFNERWIMVMSRAAWSIGSARAVPVRTRSGRMVRRMMLDIGLFGNERGEVSGYSA